jgi:hypothetical protein
MCLCVSRQISHSYILMINKQGELLRMVDFRSARVDADSADTLKIFAGLGALSLAAAAGVVVHGARWVGTLDMGVSVDRDMDLELT